MARAIGSASARLMVASVVEEKALDLDAVLRILDEASQLRAHSHSLELATTELRVANQKLKSLNHMKDGFMSSVTHELRTPFTSIRALLELMREDENMDVAQRQQSLGIIVTEAERANWRSTEVDLREVVEQVADSVLESFRERGVALELVLPASLPPVRADADRLTQGVLNLLSNALKYAPHGQGRVVIWLGAAPDGVTLEVNYNGSPGIAPDKAAVVFEKFRQVWATTIATTAVPGWGCRSAGRSWSISAGACGCAQHRGRAPRSGFRCHMHTPG